MLAFQTCEWMNCSSIAEFRCSCTSTISFYCKAHIGLHQNASEELMHNPSSILLPISAEEQEIIAENVLLENYLPRLRAIIQERNEKMNKTKEEIKKIENDYGKQIEYIVSMAKRKLDMVKLIKRTQKLPTYSIEIYACALAELKQHYDLSPYKVNSLFSLDVEKENELFSLFKDQSRVFCLRDSFEFHKKFAEILSIPPKNEFSGLSHIKSLKTDSTYVNCVQFSPDDRLLASAGRDSTILIWDLESGNCLKTLVGHKEWVKSICFSPSGSMLVSGGKDRFVRVWNIDTEYCKASHRGHTDSIFDVKFSPNSSLVASASNDHTIRLFKVPNTKSSNENSVEFLTEHTAEVLCLAFIQNGKVLVSGSKDKKIILWDVHNRSIINKLSLSSYSISMSSHRDFVVLSLKHGFAVLVGSEINEHVQKSRARSLVVSNSGSSFITVSADKYISVWGTQNVKSYFTLKRDCISLCLSISTDGRCIATGCHDGIIEVFRLVS